ncbi:four-carbon acid sugar kinase family protein [Alkaliphilus oremlandii]|uniref:Type III effector Hrp-dependent outers n=1 Tax=Alkaliphilus oremlandii (strain OhILAs) TaxID=350688 RepID=A8MJU4_ALKOO|nr:four-carbon acid sugar kinase family protein [Alkaliphilus oremlandii]ABW20076.1 type III effector Hrp-dependent outers [Alkaliphilus oremlandii OhILAs]
MLKLVIIADDLTGANATGVLLARQGFRAATFLQLNEDFKNSKQDFDVLSTTTDSRGLPSEEAYDRVHKVVGFFKDQEVQLFSKRIDSTLRGNLGAEMDAVLDGLPEDYVAVVVPVFPASERIMVGGYLLVNSVPLEKTDVSKDPKTPIHHTFVPKMIQKQTKYSVGFIPLSKTLKSSELVKEAILEERGKGHRVIVIDATTNEEIALIAKAVKDTKLNVIAVDPGPFTAALAKELIEEPNKIPGQRVMLVIGSVTNVTRKQIDELKLRFDPLLVAVNAKNLIYPETLETEINRVVERLMNNIKNHEIVGVVTTEKEEEVLNLKDHADILGITEEEASERISDGLARITKKVMERRESFIGGLYTSGGDVTVAVCKAFKSSGIAVKDEVLPLAAYGRIINGEYNNIPIITKGGLVGDSTALVKSVEYLLTKISNEYHLNVE